MIGATINKNGILRIKATKVGKETALAQIIKVVEEAQGSKAPIQRVADVISGIFVPIVVGIAIVAFVGLVLLGYTRRFCKFVRKKQLLFLLSHVLVHLDLQPQHPLWRGLVVRLN